MRTSIDSTPFRLFRRFSGTQTAVCTRALFFHTVCYILRFFPTHPPWRAGDCKCKCFRCEHRETGNSFILGLISQLVEHYHGISEVRVRVPLGLHFLGLSHYCLSCAKKTFKGNSLKNSKCLFQFFKICLEREKCRKLGQSCTRCTSSVHGCSWCEGKKQCVSGNCPNGAVIVVFMCICSKQRQLSEGIHGFNKINKSQ